VAMESQQGDALSAISEVDGVGLVERSHVPVDDRTISGS